MIDNAGFNPRKLGDVVAMQRKKDSSLRVDCETGKLLNVVDHGIVDAAQLKYIKAAGEVAAAILN